MPFLLLSYFVEYSPEVVSCHHRHLQSQRDDSTARTVFSQSIRRISDDGETVVPPDSHCSSILTTKDVAERKNQANEIENDDDDCDATNQTCERSPTNEDSFPSFSTYRERDRLPCFRLREFDRDDR